MSDEYVEMRRRTGTKVIPDLPSLQLNQLEGLTTMAHLRGIELRISVGEPVTASARFQLGSYFVTKTLYLLSDGRWYERDYSDDPCQCTTTGDCGKCIQYDERELGISLAPIAKFDLPDIYAPANSQSRLTIPIDRVCQYMT